ncbi:hypothetical protein [Streptomyces sp. NBC_01314]|uniref:hypothetical protein n=1 Tax=Streptomyces sp. NBC_01314 TaxID=2903821 RepID=UPI00308A0ABD|nr:hypothetical protein OG622_07600 [Streptomyces sp. NBC_01314]
MVDRAHPGQRHQDLADRAGAELQGVARPFSVGGIEQAGTARAARRRGGRRRGQCVAVGNSFDHRWEIRVASRTKAWAPWCRNCAVRVRRMVVLPPPVPVPTRMCGAWSTSTAIAVPSVLMPISAAEAGSA